MMRRGALTADAGAGSVLVLTAIALTVMLGSTVTVLIGSWGRTARVQTAADVAAEAAAVALLNGGQTPCHRARLATDAAAFELVRCDLMGDTVTVEVIDPDPAVPWFTPRAVSRAGPADLWVP